MPEQWWWWCSDDPGWCLCYSLLFPPYKLMRLFTDAILPYFGIYKCIMQCSRHGKYIWVSIYIIWSQTGGFYMKQLAEEYLHTTWIFSSGVHMPAKQGKLFVCVLQSWPKLIGQKKHNTGYNKIIWIYLPVNLGKEYSKWFYPILYIFGKLVSGFNFCHYLDGYFFYKQCNWNGFKTYIHSYLYC